MPTTKIRDVGQPIVQPNVAAFLKEVKELGLGYTMTSAQRDEHHKDYREGSSHTHGFACDIGIKKAGGDDMSFIEFMFGKGFDPEGKVDGDFVRPDLSPEATALFKKHNIRLIDERIGKLPHYHFEAVDSTNAKIVKAGGEANFSTSPRQGNEDKDMYFYGGDPKVFVENDYNTTKEYKDIIVNGEKVNIIGDINSSGTGVIDTAGSFKAIPVSVISVDPISSTELTREEEGVVGKVDEDGNLILTPSPIAPGTTISESGEVAFDRGVVLSQIEVDRENARRRQEEEKKKKEEVYQPKELVPLEDLSDEERAALTNEEREQYGLEPLISEEEKAAREEEERLKYEKELAEEEEYIKELQLKKEEEEKKKIKQKKAEDKVIDKDGDGIPDTIDADAGEPAPENQLTVSTEEQVVIDEQEKEEVIETVETEEIEVLDANGNIKKITVPTVKTPTTPTTVDTEGVVTEEVTTPEDVVEEKPELVKPKFKDFKTSSDYMRARMKYFKSVEEQGGENTLDFDNELDDDEIKEAVDMEQNSTVIDASKRNIFKTNGKTNIFNSVLGVVDNIAKGIQQELNIITKSINKKQ